MENSMDKKDLNVNAMSVIQNKNIRKIWVFYIIGVLLVSLWILMAFVNDSLLLDEVIASSVLISLLLIIKSLQQKEDHQVKRHSKALK